MGTCSRIVDLGQTVRILATVICLVLFSMGRIKNITLYLVVPVVLSFLDIADSLIPFMHYYRTSGMNCHHTPKYFVADKWVDMASYISFFFFFKFDPWLLFFILYRLVGVLLVAWNGNVMNIVVFFDFVKEYLLFFYFFQGKYKLALGALMVCKCAYEYYVHTRKDRESCIPKE